MGAPQPAAAERRGLARVADDGRARVRQDARRGGMDLSPGQRQAGRAPGTDRRDDRRRAKHHGRGGERAGERRETSSAAAELGTEPGTAALAERKRGAALFG